MTKTQIILSACVTIALAMLPTASAGVSVGASIAGASMEDTLSNDAENTQGANNLALTTRGYGGSTNSFANCQLALFFNTIVINLAAADSLALVEEDLVGDRLIRPNSIEIDIEPTWDNSTSDSSCKQELGPVVAAMDASDGFGEAAPQGGSVAALGEALWSSQQLNGGGVAVAAAVSGASLNDVLENEFTSFQGSGVNSASSCQILVTWNTLLINAGLAIATAEVDTNVTGETELPEVVIPLKSQSEGSYEKGLENELESSTSTCHQSIASLTLIIGDRPELPPQS